LSRIETENISPTRIVATKPLQETEPALDTGALDGLSPEARREALARIPMRRFGRPEEVAAAVRFLACSEAGYITGSALKIDGGIL
jgi:NAD(P)-dependent dehydrogenase (short-subunit alcohol dehydrogenase family)